MKISDKTLDRLLGLFFAGLCIGIVAQVKTWAFALFTLCGAMFWVTIIVLFAIRKEKRKAPCLKLLP